MKRTHILTLAKTVMLCAASSLLQACASGAPAQHAEVAGAFQSSNVVALKPYTRTIFSSNDF